MYLLCNRLHSDDAANGAVIASDYEASFISCNPLNESAMRSYNIVLTGEHQSQIVSEPRHRADVSRETDWELSPALLLSTWRQLSDGQRDNMLRAFNTVFSHRPNSLSFTNQLTHPPIHQSYTRAGKNKFFQIAGQSLPQGLGPHGLTGDFQGLQAFIGFFLSTRAPLDGQRLLLNINTKTSAFFPSCTVATLLAVLSRQPNWQLTKLLRGIRVTTRYASGTGDRRAYKIANVTDRNAGSEYLTHNGVKKTVEQYFFDSACSLSLYHLDH